MTISNTKWLFFLAEHTFTSLGYRAFIHLKKKKKIQWNKERITLWQALSQPEESLFICW